MIDYEKVYANAITQTNVRHVVPQDWPTFGKDPHKYALQALAAAHAEREACETTAWNVGMDAHNKHRGLPVDAREVGSNCASAIRARKGRK